MVAAWRYLFIVKRFHKFEPFDSVTFGGAVNWTSWSCGSQQLSLGVNAHISGKMWLANFKNQPINYYRENTPRDEYQNTWQGIVWGWIGAHRSGPRCGGSGTVAWCFCPGLNRSWRWCGNSCDCWSRSSAALWWRVIFWFIYLYCMLSICLTIAGLHNRIYSR